MADEYINKKDVVNLGVMMQTHLWTREQTYNAIFCLPSADVAPVRHGRWIDKGDGAECSICGSFWKYAGAWDKNGIARVFRYCETCGTRMDEEADA